MPKPGPCNQTMGYSSIVGTDEQKVESCEPNLDRYSQPEDEAKSRQSRSCQNEQMNKGQGFETRAVNMNDELQRYCLNGRTKLKVGNKLKNENNLGLRPSSAADQQLTICCGGSRRLRENGITQQNWGLNQGATAPLLERASKQF